MGWFTFTAGGGSDVFKFYRLYDCLTSPVKNDVILWASGYGAKFKRQIHISEAQKQRLMAMRGDSNEPKDERAAISRIVGEVEKIAEEQLGMRDEAGLAFRHANNPTQTDCVDEAWNSTAVMLWMRNHKLIRCHEIREPVARWAPTKWNHFGAMIREFGTDLKFVIDSGVSDGGKPAAVVPLEKWYV